MLEVATAGKPTQTISEVGTCERTDGETMPMLMLLPRPSVAHEPLPASAYAPPSTAPPPGPFDLGGVVWRLSGASGEFGMIGLGDIVLPALAITFARRIDLASTTDSSCCGYYAWAVVGYILGLTVALCANAFAWTINGVDGQPALLYLVPGVIGSQLIRSALRGETGSLWKGEPLPQPPTDTGTIGCDGCGKALHGEESVWSDARKNVDYCPKCYDTLAQEKCASLVSNAVWKRCGLDPPQTNQPPLL